jgi:hypothetical protein
MQSGKAITIEPEILLTITHKTTREELDGLVKKMEEKGIALSYDEIKYENGMLVKISGTLETKNNSANFNAVDFNKVIISWIQKAGKAFFRIDEVVKKRGVS